MTEEYQTVILAALLHDIGKFLQRGSFGSLNIEGKHPEVSSRFISAYHSLFEQVSDATLLKTLVQHHHEHGSFRPDLSVQDLPPGRTRTLAYLISKADNLSSSERGGRTEQYQDFKATPLVSIFGRVSLCKDEKANILRYHPLPLTDTSSLSAIFPDNFVEYRTGEMNQLLTSFGNEFQEFATLADKSNFDCLFTHLLGFLQKYTWCIPSNTQEEIPDVSLYDHLKTTAATAACLYQYHIATDTLDEEHIKDDTERFRLVVGDLSGIQDYIFDIATSGAGGVAKRLRARSLYIQLLTEVACHKILREMDLPFANIVMSSGGRFYLLLPDISEAKDVVQSVQHQVDDWFLRQLNGELALNLAAVTFGKEGFEAGKGSKTGFGKVLQDLNSELALRKRHRFAETLRDQQTWTEDAFLLGEFHGEQLCRSCHKFPLSGEDLCTHCEQDLRIGANLPRANYIAFFSEGNVGDIPLLGYSASITSQLGFSRPPYLVFKLNHTYMRELYHYPALPKYIANYTPTAESFNCDKCRMRSTCEEKPDKPDEMAKFNCLAYESDGRPLLGFLKADVDNLGATFIYGLKRDSPEGGFDTISRLSTLSRQMDTFFSGWVERLTSSDFTHCYTIFSGGDDLFLVGPWSEITSLAARIKHDFTRYAGNPQMTLSAGVFLSAPRFPISRASREANQLLDSSKNAGRNAITILGYSIPWDRWELLERQWTELKPHLDKVPSAFLYKLLQYGQMWNRYDHGKGDVLELRFQPLLAYSLARNTGLKKESPQIYDWAEGLVKIRPGDENQGIMLDNLALIATLLILNKG
jgi:CRISPR-associated protein Csm1